MPIRTIGRTTVFTGTVHHVFPTVYVFSFSQCVNEYIACYALRKQSTHTTCPPLFICWRFYMFQKKNPRIFPPVCFRLASSWSMMPAEVVKTMNLQRIQRKNMTRLFKMLLLIECISPQVILYYIADICKIFYNENTKQ